MISVLIPATNEAHTLHVCLESVRWSDDIVVVDGGSDDGTAAIAREFGARLIEHPFVNSARQKNWALENLRFANPWILILDADERVPEDLSREMQRAVRACDCDGFWISRKNFVGTRWIRHGGWFPDWTLRLVKQGNGSYDERAVHAEMHVRGPVAYLRSPLVHHSRRDIADHAAHLNRYSSLESAELHRKREKSRAVHLISMPSALRWCGVRLWRLCPVKPVFVFVWHYIVWRGFLDGRWGAILAAMESFNLAIVHAKRRERVENALLWKHRMRMMTPRFTLRSFIIHALTRTHKKPLPADRAYPRPKDAKVRIGSTPDGRGQLQRVADTVDAVLKRMTDTTDALVKRMTGIADAAVLRRISKRGKRFLGVWIRVALRRMVACAVCIDTKVRVRFTAPPRSGIARILAVHLFGMGDLLMAVPSLKGLRQIYPHALIVILVREQYRAIAQMIGDIDGVIAIPGPDISEGMEKNKWINLLNKKR
jgi:glycosyltransferase involved in cell wall biosynthesis